MIKPHSIKCCLTLLLIVLFTLNPSTLEAQATIPFVTTWKTDNPGTSANNQITIPTFGSGYNYTVDWGDSTTPTAETGNATHTYATPGIYTVSIIGDFPRIYFGNLGDKEKLLTIEQWGNNQWVSMQSAFFGCSNLQGNFTDSPDLSSVIDIRYMFRNASMFNYDISNWDVSNVTNMSGLFFGASSFNNDIGNWNVGNVTDMSDMFRAATNFNQNIGNWNVGSVTDMRDMFFDAVNFNQDIGNWDVSNVLNMLELFRNAVAFNQDIGGWDVSNTTNMYGMFLNTTFNQDISGWNVSNVTDMGNMFGGTTAFNQDISNWNVSNVVEMSSMFADAVFNQDIGNWNVANVTRMQSMFYRAVAFNQDIGNWNVSKVTNMSSMFNGASSFDQNLGAWNVSNAIFLSNMFRDVTLSTSNYDALLIGWNMLNLMSNRNFHGGNSKYCAGETARANIISNDNWTITDGGIDLKPSITDLTDQNAIDSFVLPGIFGANFTTASYYTGTNGTGTKYDPGDLISYADFPSYPITIYIYGESTAGCSTEQDFQLTISQGSLPFITTWKTDNPGTSANNQIIIPTFGGGYNYTVDWGDGTAPTTETGNATHTYVTPGTYTVRITGDFPRIYFNDSGDKDKILTIEQWGDNSWTSMYSAFLGCSNLQGNFTDAPDLSNVTNLSQMFARATSFNHDLNNWDVSNVVNMRAMFSNATSFNGNISAWNTNQVTDMGAMFFGSGFNQGIGNWDVSSVTNMNAMFWNATVFNQDIGNWDVSKVTNMLGMFVSATVFNQNIGNWNVSNVTDMSAMFGSAITFNQDIGNWNVSSVTQMNGMFNNAASFNQDIGNWNVSNVTNMSGMFANAILFNQNLSVWNVENLTNAANMFLGVTLSTINYDALLIGWNAQNLNSGVSFHGGNSKYCAGATARANMISSDSWNISDGGIAAPSINPLANQNAGGSYMLPTITGTDLVGNEAYYTGSGGTGTKYDIGDVINFTDFPTYPVVLYIYGGVNASCFSEQSFQLTLSDPTEPFITTWKTDNPGVSGNDQITIPIFSGPNTYTVDWGDGTPPTTEVNEATHTYATPGIYTVSITGNYALIAFNDQGDKDKILTVDQWGKNQWIGMFAAFQGCSNLQGNFTDSPDLSNVDITAYMFQGASSFNYDISNWDVSNVTNMQAMFSDALIFDQDISNWDVSNVTDMVFLFNNTSFNQDISNWDVSSVVNMGGTFAQNPVFNQDISNWDVSNVKNMEFTFFEASAFNQDIGNWDVGNVEIMEAMFARATAFNQDIGGWNTSSVNDTGAMFYEAVSFNQDIGNWDVSKVTRMEIMFYGATSFNQDIGNWDVISATNMIEMFAMATSFDQDLGNWNVINVTDMTDMFKDVRLSVPNYDSLLIGWDSKVLQSNVPFNGGLSQYCLGEAARTNMMSNDNWNITDRGSVAPSVDAIVNQNVSDSYILPAITGVNLTGNESYYTETNGAGTVFNVGDVINFNDFPSYPITLYIYDSFSSGCDSEQTFQLTITSVPSCTALTAPLSGETNVLVDSNLTWSSVATATGYKLTVGTSSGGGEILNALDVGNVLSYDLPSDLPDDSTIFVIITPYNADGDAVACAEERFTTERLISLPQCTLLTAPLSGATNVLVDSNLTWSAVATATGYKLTVGTSSEGGEILNALDVGNVLSYDLPSDLPDDSTIYVIITPYNADGDAVACAEERFTTERLISLPQCTVLTAPLSGATNVLVDSNLTWSAVATATGYKLTVGTSSGGGEILNALDVGNVLSYDLPSDLPDDSTIYVIITPYNADGDAVACTEAFFTTEALISLPSCTALSSPLNGDVDVALGTDLTWNDAMGAIGYRLTIGTSSDGNDILNDLDVGNVLSYDLSPDLPENSSIYVTITPYNLDGDATGCIEDFFVTEISSVSTSASPPKFFTPNNDNKNDYWIVPDSSNQILRVFIYNRYGKLLKQIVNTDVGWDGTFNGKAMPNDDYWYLITYRDGRVLKGHFSLVR